MDGEGRHVDSREHAVTLDAHDPLSHIRKEFKIPTKAQLKAKSLSEAGKNCHFHPAHYYVSTKDSSESRDGPTDLSIYLCGNSLGLPPRLAETRLSQHFATWSSQGVFGHFKPLAGSPLPTWLDADTKASESMAPLVGAKSAEVAIMETLTANLHLLMGAFYKPDIKGRHKIMLESKAFPSDHVSPLFVSSKF
jgi:kynureninase